MRYLAAVFLFFSVVSVAALVVFSVLLGVSPILVVLMVAVLYGLGLAADLLPPGYPPVSPLSWPPASKREIDERTADAIPHPVPGEERLAAATPPEDAQMLAAQRGPSKTRSTGKKRSSTRPATAPSSAPIETVFQHRYHSAPAWVIAAGLVVAVFVAAWFISSLRSTHNSPAPESAVAAFNAPRPATSVSAAQAPWAPSAAAEPAASPSPSPSASPALNGTWLITDTVKSGPGTGQSFQLYLALTEANGTITGTSQDMTLSGRRDGNRVDLNFARVGSRGTFSWSITPDGKLDGAFTDTNSASTSKGSSAGVRE